MAMVLSRILTPSSLRLKCSRRGSLGVGCMLPSSSNLFLMASFMNSALLLYPRTPCVMISSISSMSSFGSLTVVYSSVDMTST